MSFSKKVAVSALLLTLVIGAMYRVFSEPNRLVQRYLDQRLTCYNGGSLLVDITSKDGGRSISISSDGKDAVKLDFKLGGPFNEEYSNDAGQRLQIYDGNLDLIHIFGRDLMSCDLP